MVVLEVVHYQYSALFEAIGGARPSFLHLPIGRPTGKRQIELSFSQDVIICSYLNLECGLLPSKMIKIIFYCGPSGVVGIKIGGDF